MGSILHWVVEYGYAAIFGGLVLGIVGLPVPDETMLTFVGYLTYKGTLDLIPALVVAFCGSICGISISYLLGKYLGHKVLLKYGRYLHITPERLEKTHTWFEKSGRWTLAIGYFIPGVRHITAYVAGSSELEFPTFALFAYTGALVWSSSFILLGHLLGHKWREVPHFLHQNLKIVLPVAVVLLAGYILFRWLRRTKEHPSEPSPSPDTIDRSDMVEAATEPTSVPPPSASHTSDAT